jgi:hypothetical protein
LTTKTMKLQTGKNGTIWRVKKPKECSSRDGKTKKLRRNKCKLIKESRINSKRNVIKSWLTNIPIVVDVIMQVGATFAVNLLARS